MFLLKDQRMVTSADVMTPLLNTFSKLREVTASIIMCVHPSICLFICMKQLISHWMDFREILFYV
jgi:hypothetical protein